MKKILSITILSLIITFTSCNKVIDEQPISEGALSDFFQNKLHADAAIAGMYGEFQHAMIGEGQFQNRITWWGEARSDNWETRAAYATSSTNEIHLNGLTENNQYADWSPLYSTIGRANLILRNLPLIKNYVPVGTIGALSLAQEDNYRAQALAMRALCYFWIVRVWGDAPLRLEPYQGIDEKAEQPRDSKDIILAQCIKDLEEAYSLTVKNATPTVWYLGEGAICSILADIYMWQKDYPNAIVWFKNLFKAKSPMGKVFNTAGTGVTGSGGSTADLQSGTTWNTQFVTPAASVESIFSIHWNYIANGCACMSGVSRTTNENTIRMGTELWTTWPTVSTQVFGTNVATTDLRVKQTYNITNANNQPARDRSFWKFYSGSYVAPTATVGYNFTSQPYVNNLPASVETDVFIPVYRLSGMYLLYAEALNKIGERANAVKYLNLIKQRAGVPIVNAADFDESSLELAILKERQFELIGEGVRWFDLVRTDRVKEIMDPVLVTRQAAIGNPQVGWGDDKNRYFWPLAVRVLYSNNLLIQNDPYKN